MPRAALILLLVAACVPRDAAPVPGPLPLGPPLDRGEAQVRLTGAVTAEHTFTAVACTPGPRAYPRWALHLPIADVTAEPPWAVMVDGGGNGAPGQLVVSQGRAHWIGGAEPGAVPGRATLTAAKATSEAGSIVTVDVSVRCPDMSINAVPDPIVNLLADASGRPVRRFVGADFGRLQDARGVSVEVAPEAATGLVEGLRGTLPTGWVAYVGTTRDLSGDLPGGDPAAQSTVEVAIGPGADAADIVRLAHVDPVNYGLDAEDVAARVSDWAARYRFTLLKADTETIEGTIPADIDVRALATEVAAFCPDVVSQGTGSVEALAADMETSKRLYCWWD